MVHRCCPPGATFLPFYFLMKGVQAFSFTVSSDDHNKHSGPKQVTTASGREQAPKHMRRTKSGYQHLSSFILFYHHHRHQRKELYRARALNRHFHVTKRPDSTNNTQASTHLPDFPSQDLLSSLLLSLLSHFLSLLPATSPTHDIDNPHHRAKNELFCFHKLNTTRTNIGDTSHIYPFPLLLPRAHMGFCVEVSVCVQVPVLGSVFFILCCPRAYLLLLHLDGR
jgi:hypothetical protein